MDRDDDFVVEIACGAEHALARTARGELVCWGSNEHGKFGLPSSTDSALLLRMLCFLDS